MGYLTFITCNMTLSNCWCGCKLAEPFWKTTWKKLSIELPRDLAILLNVRAKIIGLHKNVYMDVLSSITDNSQNV